MAEVAQSHETLLKDIQNTDLPYGQGAFWWMGQHTFIVRVNGKVIYIDPWFAPWESRQTPTLLDYEEARMADIALVTHGHGDHLCPESLTAMVNSSPNAQFISPCTEASRMLEEGHIPENRLHTLNAGGVWENNGVKVTAIKSKHEFFDEHPTLGFPYLGYVIETGGLTIYHSGDCIMYDGLVNTLKQWNHFDVMFVPINGRDAERFLVNCLGNLTFQEAAELAGELQPGLVVPAHYDMFIGNQEDPSKFVRFLEAKFPGIKSWVGKAGKCILFGK